MALEETLMSVVTTTDPTIAADLAVFTDDAGARPAIFYGDAPSDTDPGWTAAQYPRLELLVDRKSDWSRDITGTLTIHIEGLAQASAVLDSLEIRVRALFQAAAYHPAGEPVVGLQHQDTAPYEQERRTDEGEAVIGYTQTYQIVGFPSQALEPVTSLNAWAAATWPTQLYVDPSTWAPSAAKPALYWRFIRQALRTDRVFGDWPTVEWFQATLAAHVLAPGPADRIPWLQAIVQTLAATRQIRLTDGSPLFFDAVAADSTADVFRAGQITLTATFGLLLTRTPRVPVQTIELRNTPSAPDAGAVIPLTILIP